MFDKLESLADRYAELSEAIAQPEVIRDFPRYQACLKERSALQPLADKYTEYISVSRRLKEAEDLLSDPPGYDVIIAAVPYYSRCPGQTHHPLPQV